jgi:calcium-dependent protein kinase
MKEVKSGGVNRHQFIMANTDPVTDHYDMKQKLGEGSFGTCCRGMHKASKRLRAIKSVGKSNLKDLIRFQQEIDIMKMMDHPNIIRLYEMFEDDNFIYLVMELCTGGELFDKIMDNGGTLNEMQSAVVMQQTMRGMFYMHENKITHRDIKPENFLLGNREPVEHNVLKIIDFGLSAKFEPGVPLTSKAGTPYYVAPEVLAGSYDE